MAGVVYTDKELEWLKDQITEHNKHPRDLVDPINKKFHKGRRIRTINGLMVILRRHGLKVSYAGTAEAPPKVKIPWQKIKPKSYLEQTQTDKQWIIESAGRFNTVDEALTYAQVDRAIWEVDKIVVNGWDVTAKKGDDLQTVQNKQIKVWLRRKVSKSMELGVKRLMERLEKKSPIVPLFKYKPVKKIKYRRALEPCCPDPHYGMNAHKPGADANQTIDSCAKMLMDVSDEIIALSGPYGPFEQIILPLGNDFFHTDTVFNTTTAGTGQPEAESYYHTFVGGEALAIEIVERFKKLAPVFIYSIPGNHDRTTSFMLGRVLKAYYHNDKNVTVQADESPYKFHRYGVNLIGYEHGHSVKPPIRLAALMANECPEDWLKSKHGYREWHLGDQHRKGSSRPSVMEEQGVSVEYLPGLTVPNEWHRLKSFNWQQRAAMGFVWDYSAGPIARLQVNIDRYLNDLMGRK